MNPALSRKIQVILLLLASVLLLSMVFALLNKNSILAIPGNILFSGFHVAAFLIPLHVILLLFFVQRDIYWKSVVFWGLLIFPFLTLVLTVKSIIWKQSVAGTGVDYLVQSLGKWGSVFMLSVLVILQIYVLLRLYVSLLRKEEPEEEATQVNAEHYTPQRIMSDTFEQKFFSDDALLIPIIPHPKEKTVINMPYLSTSKDTSIDTEEESTVQVNFAKPRSLIEYNIDNIQDITQVDELDETTENIIRDEALSQDSEKSREVHPFPQDQDTDNYHVPVEDIFITSTGNTADSEEDIEHIKGLLRETLGEFGIEVQVTGVYRGSSITRFEVLPSPGIKLARISNLADNIALRLAAESIRIVSPIPGKHAVGIEIPNRKREIVRFGDLVNSNDFKNSDCIIPIALGEAISGEKSIIDLTMTPHILIAGATGSGKSVCVNALICSILSQCSPQEVKLILVDPKIVELKVYNDVPHLLTPVVTQSARVFQVLQYCTYEMEHRYNLLESMEVRNIAAYNEKVAASNKKISRLPYIVLIIDEFADLMASTGKELEASVARLAAMSRAVGIHLVLATQRPSTDVITGLIKANIPSRIAFMVASKVDSRIILDTMGADKLLGRGDMLFSSAWQPFPNRIQGAYISENELVQLTDYVRSLGKAEYIDDEIFIDEEESSQAPFEHSDPVFPDALDIVRRSRKASASYLQRRLKIGYNRAARLIEVMEERGIVGGSNGSKAREVLIE